MSTVKRTTWALCIILTIVLIRYFSSDFNQSITPTCQRNAYTCILLQLLYYAVPTLVLNALFHGPDKIFKEWGIQRGFLKGGFYGFLFTLPMLAGYALLGEADPKIDLFKLILVCFKDGFREELFYRAFVFGQLFRHVKLGFFPAVAINGVIFGLSHLYQANSLLDSFLVFTITFGGAVWFAWLYMEWEENLWLPVFMHFLMNLYWDLFSVDNSAIGSWMNNIPRILTIALSIVITTRIIRKKGNRKITPSLFFKQ